MINECHVLTKGDTKLSTYTQDHPVNPCPALIAPILHGSTLMGNVSTFGTVKKRYHDMVIKLI